MEDITPRQAEILTLARQSGRVAVEMLAERFAVTPQTIRKDLNDLCDRRILQRVHGGAVVGSGIENVGYEARRLMAAAEKARIGQRAAAMIPDNCSLFMNIGTTTEQVASALVSHQGLMSITNNINVANILRASPGIEVIVAGGVLRRGDGGIVGEVTVEFIGQFKVDFAIIGTSAIDEDGALLDYDYREVRVSQAIIQNARHVILVADSTKLTRSAPVRIGHLSQIHTLVTDIAPPAALRKICRDTDVEIVIAEAGESAESSFDASI